jgi:hypothetical protein
VDNYNGITNEVNFSRWVDSGGVYGYYDWLYQNGLAIEAVPGLSVEFGSMLRNSATLKHHVLTHNGPRKNHPH